MVNLTAVDGMPNTVVMAAAAGSKGGVRIRALSDSDAEQTERYNYTYHSVNESRLESVHLGPLSLRLGETYRN